MDRHRSERNVDSPPTETKKSRFIIMRENIYTVPNALSASRLALSPCIGWMISNGHYQLAFGSFIAAGITDLFDGWVARKFNKKTMLGSILDPLADKTLMTILTVALASQSQIPFPLAALILTRDVSLTLGAAYYRFISLPKPRSFSTFFDPSLATVNIRPTMISKINTVLQLGLIGYTLAICAFPECIPFDWHGSLEGLQYLVGGTTLLSGLSYLMPSAGAVRILKRRPKV